MTITAVDFANAAQLDAGRPGGAGMGALEVDWGDGSADRGPTHVYERPGRRRLSILLRDAVGNARRITRIVRVTAPYRAGARPVAVVLDPTQEPGVPGYQMRRARAVADALRRAGTPVRVVGRSVLSDARRLRRFATVVLVYERAMGDATRRRLLRYVRGGGGLVGLFYLGRDDADHVPLTSGRKAVAGIRWSRESEWGILSPLMGGVGRRARPDPVEDLRLRVRPSTTFLNDVVARWVVLGAATGPAAAAIRRAGGGTLATVRLAPASGRLDMELAAPGRSVHPFLVVRGVAGGIDCTRADHGCRHDRFRAGSPAGLARAFGRGRVAWIGVPLADALVEPAAAPATGGGSPGAGQIIVGAVDWTGRLR